MQPLKRAKTQDTDQVIYIEVDRKKLSRICLVDVAVAEVSEKSEVPKKSLETYRENKKTQKYYL